jgi:hypothetical protein
MKVKQKLTVNMGNGVFGVHGVYGVFLRVL